MRAGEILRERLGRWTGLDLARGGREDAVDRLLGERMKVVGAASADAYVAGLQHAGDVEVSWLVNALTVGHTWFFRDAEQTAAVSQLLAKARTRPVRVWIAGCATGEEAYTVAMLAQSLATPVEILATDINSKAIERAREGEYSPWSVREVPRELSAMLVSSTGGRVRVGPDLQRLVRFEQHNLMDSPPAPRTGPGWQLVLCRNVLIYFRPEDVPVTVLRLANALAVDGHLIFGAGEVLRYAPPGFTLVPIGQGSSIRYALRRDPDGAVRASSAFVAPLPVIAAPPVAPAPPPDDLLARALERIEGGHAAEAIPLCARALQNDPLSPEAHLVSGIAFHLSDDPRSAVHALRSSLLLDPDEWIASFYLALSYEKLGRDEQARRAYLRVQRASQHAGQRRSRLPTLEAYRDEISILSRARSRGPLGR